MGRIIDYIRMATIDHAIIDLTLDFDPAAVFGKFFQRKRPKVVRIEAAGCRFFEMATKVQGAGTGYEDARIRMLRSSSSSPVSLMKRWFCTR